MTKETKQFQAEIKDLLNLMVHSLYSNREIFLRELISNASDALDRLRLEELADKSISTSDSERHIRLIPNKDERTITIVDNGIGMSKDELIQNIGTIAHSGTKAFLQKAKELKQNPEMIGQFGVGFYSAFMVADKVSIHTHRAGSDTGVVWESAGDGSYTIEDQERSEGHGTTITLHLKEKEGDDESFQDFTEEWTVRSTVKKYSDFIPFPIKMKVTSTEPKKDDKGEVIEGESETVVKDETLNSMKALWLKSSSEIKKEEYNEFYKQVSHDWMDPLDVIHFHAEGTHEFSALAYLPSTVPMDYNQRGTKYGLNLYVKRVFIMPHCEDLVPPYFRFLKGVVESNDLPLNVSREILQKDRQILQIKKALTTKLFKHFQTMLDKDREKYEKFWEKFGPTIKEGIPSDFANKEKVEKISLFRSTNSDKWTSLDEYIERMKDEQKAIYYITGESLSQLNSSPYLERLKQKGYEVLFLVDPVDEFVMRSMDKYKDKEIISITQENLNLESDEEKKQNEDEKKEKESKLEPITKIIKEALSENVKEVRISDRLIDSPVCLVSGSDDPSAYMERMMESMGQKMPKAKRILEINPDHPIFEKMMKSSENTQKVWAEILYNQALLNEGSVIEDPMKFSKQISELMVNTQI